MYINNPYRHIVMLMVAGVQEQNAVLESRLQNLITVIQTHRVALKSIDTANIVPVRQERKRNFGASIAQTHAEQWLGGCPGIRLVTEDIVLEKRYFLGRTRGGIFVRKWNARRPEHTFTILAYHDDIPFAAEVRQTKLYGVGTRAEKTQGCLTSVFQDFDLPVVVFSPFTCATSLERETITRQAPYVKFVDSGYSAGQLDHAIKKARASYQSPERKHRDQRRAQRMYKLQQQGRSVF
jgi:hypothetical protein